MALNKAHFQTLGTEDAQQYGEPRRCPVVPGTWQYKAYMAAYEAAVNERESAADEAVLPKSNLIAEFHKVVLGRARKLNQVHKRADAIVARIRRKHHLASFDVKQPRASRYYPDLPSVSENIRRAGLRVSL